MSGEGPGRARRQRHDGARRQRASRRTRSPPPRSRWRASPTWSPRGDEVVDHPRQRPAGRQPPGQERAGRRTSSRRCPLDWCGAQTQATLGFVLMNALDGRAGGARASSGPVAALVTRTLVDRDDPGFSQPDQADRPLPAGGGGAGADRARPAVRGPRRAGLAARRRLTRAAARSSTPARSRRCVAAGLRRGRRRWRRHPGRARGRRPPARRRGRDRQGPRPPRCSAAPSTPTCSSSPPTSTTRWSTAARRSSAPLGR